MTSCPISFLLVSLIVSPAGAARPRFGEVSQSTDQFWVPDDCYSLDKANCSKTGSSCLWIQGIFESTSYCRSKCFNYNESDCPRLECRWSSSTLQAQCIPRVAGDACTDLSGTDQCETKDCTCLLPDGKTCSRCFPKCHRYSRSKCPGGECELVNGTCHPRNLPSDLLCAELSEEQCSVLLPGLCSLMPLNDSRLLVDRLFGEVAPKYICESTAAIEEIRGLQKAALNRQNPSTLLPDVQHLCRQHETQEDCHSSRFCEWRMFSFGEGKKHQERCTVNWHTDIEKQKLFAKFAKQIPPGTNVIEWGVLVARTARNAMEKIFPPPERDSALARFGLFGLIFRNPTLPQQSVFEAATGMAFAYLSEAFAEQVATWYRGSAEWKNVRVASANFCQQMFLDIPLRDPDLVSKVGQRLETAEPLCTQRLTGESSARWASNPPSWLKIQDDLCEDLCIDLVDTIHHNIANIFHLTEINLNPGVPEKAKLLEACAETAIRPVESHILGCCGRACGWNMESGLCENYIFMTPPARETWLKECCSEIQIANGSDRQTMCNSVADKTEQRSMNKLDEKQRVHDEAFLLGFSRTSESKEIHSGLLQIEDSTRARPNSRPRPKSSPEKSCQEHAEEENHKDADQCGKLSSIARNACKLKEDWHKVKSPNAETTKCWEGFEEVEHAGICLQRGQKQKAKVVEFQLRSLSLTNGVELGCRIHEKIENFGDCHSFTADEHSLTRYRNENAAYLSGLSDFESRYVQLLPT